MEKDFTIEARVRGRGMRVKGMPTGASVAARQDDLRSLAEPMITRAQQLNLTDAQLLAVVKSVLKERKQWANLSSARGS